MIHTNQRSLPDPFIDLQAATRQHRIHHQCGAYTFEDGLALTDLVRTYDPQRIVELGTALGYTACCLAYGSSVAHVDTIEGDPDHVRLARMHIAHTGLESRITVHHGDFTTTLAGLPDGYDMAFFDGFAPSLELLMHLRRALTDGGLLVCSNLQLGHGREALLVADECANRAHWSLHTAIEGGRTVVLRKRTAQVA